MERRSSSEAAAGTLDGAVLTGAVHADLRRRNYHVLDGLRGVAAAAVLALHLRPAFAPLPIRSGYLAVDLFFLMSGFVIAAAYDRRLAAGMTATAFMRVRLVRLYPLYALAVAAMTLAIVAGLFGMGLSDWSRITLVESVATAILMLPAPGLRGPELFPLAFMAWSLVFELAFNGLHAVCFRALRDIRLVAAVVGFGAALLFVDLWSGTVDWGADWPGCLFAVPRTGFSFFLGVLFFRAHRDGRLPRIHVPAPLLLAATAAILMLGPTAPHRSAWDAAAVGVLFPLLLCAAVTREPSRLRVYTMLGEASYPAYILQAVLIAAVAHMLKRAGIALIPSRPWGALLVIGVVMAIGWLAGVTIDPWMRGRLSALVRARPRVDRRPAVEA